MEHVEGEKKHTHTHPQKKPQTNEVIKISKIN